MTINNEDDFKKATKELDNFEEMNAMKKQILEHNIAKYKKKQQPVKNSDSIIKEIEAIRVKNNRLWMSLLSIAMKYATEETKEVMRQVRENDLKVSELCGELVNVPVESGNSVNKVVNTTQPTETDYTDWAKCRWENNPEVDKIKSDDKIAKCGDSIK